ncbi:MAG: ATP-binding cassette domain-containing protein, partial [Erysipelotrichaceae bacterium]
LLRETDVGYMGHDAELFSGSIEENIKMGKEGDISEVLKAVCLDEEIKEFPDGLDTVVGDNERLSGGQKSRLILSRTLYHKKPLMILDDPFSAVDMKTEEKVFNNMQKICSDSIVLLISHRLSLFDKLNKVIYIGNGNVTVSKHEELLQNCSDYRQLYYAQRKEAGHEK